MDVRRENRKKTLFRRRISEKKMLELCSQLGFALDGELTLPMSLMLIGNEIPGKTEKQFLQHLSSAVSDGKMLSEALMDNPIVYPPLFLQFITAGEQNGNLKGAIRDAESWFLHRQQMRKQMISALVYPLLVTAMTVCAFVMMLVLIGPVIRDTYASLEAPMPPVTESVLSAGEWILAHRYLLIGGMSVGTVGLWIMLHSALKKADFQYQWNRFMGSIPFFGKLYRQYWFVQIGQTIGVLLESGLLPAESMSACCRVYRNSIFRWELSVMESDILAGESFVEILRKGTFVPEMARNMLQISHETGNVGKMLISLSRYYRQLLEYTLRLFASILEPVMIIVLGFGILVIAGSLFLPMMESYQYLLI